MPSGCSQHSRNSCRYGDVTDHEIDDVGEYIQVALAADLARVDLDDAIELLGNVVGRIALAETRGMLSECVFSEPRNARNEENGFVEQRSSGGAGPSPQRSDRRGPRNMQTRP
jgi:hypothetical protein